jgi:hypothetical protein
MLASSTVSAGNTGKAKLVWKNIYLLTILTAKMDRLRINETM